MSPLSEMAQLFLRSQMKPQQPLLAFPEYYSSKDTTPPLAPTVRTPGD